VRFSPPARRTSGPMYHEVTRWVGAGALLGRGTSAFFFLAGRRHADCPFWRRRLSRWHGLAARLDRCHSHYFLGLGFWRIIPTCYGRSPELSTYHKPLTPACPWNSTTALSAVLSLPWVFRRGAAILLCWLPLVWRYFVLCLPNAGRSRRVG